MATIPADQRVVRAPVLWRRSGDQLLIRRRGSDDLIVLAGTGVALWDALAEPVALSALIDRLAADHGSTADVVGPDVEAAVARLVSQRIVETT